MHKRSTRQKLPEEVTKRGLVRGSGLWYTIARTIFRPILEEIEIMSNETQAAIDEMKTTMSDLASAVQAMHTAVIDSLASIEGAKDDPEQIQQIISEAKANINQLLSDAAALTPAGEAPTPPDEEPPVEPPVEPEA